MSSKVRKQRPSYAEAGVFYMLEASSAEIREQADDLGLLDLMNTDTVKGLRSFVSLKHLEDDFAAMTSYTYYVKGEGIRKRPMYIEEQDEPHEYIYSDSVEHGSEEMRKKYALLLWLLTGYGGYATIAGLRIEYERKHKKTISNAVSVFLEHADEVKNAVAWWESKERVNEISEAIKEAKKRSKSVSYKNRPRGTEPIKPYVEWDTAASAVVGMRLASSKSQRSAWKVKFGKDLRPDEKAQFIREYKVADNRTSDPASVAAAREIQGVCDKIEDYLARYDYLSDAKAVSIITTLKRSNYFSVSKRQDAYLRNCLLNLERKSRVKSGKKVSEEVAKVDAAFYD